MIRLVVALTEDHVIAKNGELPFHLSDDLKHFKALTKGRTVVMGRKTYDSIGRPLPDRKNVIMMRYPHAIENAYVVDGTKQLFGFFGNDFDVIGGSEIYRLFLEMGVIDELIVTHIHDTVKEGVLTRMPVNFLDGFVKKETLFAQDKDENNDASFTVVRYVRSEKE
ncbi:dihydrofolate reductase [Vibrio parahaemolyticus]|nr:dihydrofolate reductase [Vibrio parahaemolyticus]